MDDAKRTNAIALKVGYAGMLVFIASLSILFGATIVAFIVIGLGNREWRPEDLPSLPITFWLSTFLIVLSSFTFRMALKSLRGRRFTSFKSLIWLTLLLGIAFLVNQSFSWFQLARTGITAKSSLYGFTFYLLTGIHYLHVLGGLVPLWVVTSKSASGPFSPSYYAKATYTSIYWHFLDVVWVLIFVCLLIFW